MNSRLSGEGGDSGPGDFGSVTVLTLSSGSAVRVTLFNTTN